MPALLRAGFNRSLFGRSWVRVYQSMACTVLEDRLCCQLTFHLYQELKLQVLPGDIAGQEAVAKEEEVGSFPWQCT